MRSYDLDVLCLKFFYLFIFFSRIVFGTSRLGFYFLRFFAGFVLLGEKEGGI